MWNTRRAPRRPRLRLYQPSPRTHRHRAAHPDHPLHRGSAPRPRQDRTLLPHHQHRASLHSPRAPQTRRQESSPRSRSGRPRPGDRRVHRDVQRTPAPGARSIASGRVGRERLASANARQSGTTRRPPAHGPQEPGRAARRHSLPGPALPRSDTRPLRRAHDHNPLRPARHLRDPRVRPRHIRLHRRRRSPPQSPPQPPRHRNRPPSPPPRTPTHHQRPHPHRRHPRRATR